MLKALNLFVSSIFSLMRQVRWSPDAVPLLILVVAMLSLTLVLNCFNLCDVFLQPTLRYVMGPPPF